MNFILLFRLLNYLQYFIQYFTAFSFANSKLKVNLLHTSLTPYGVQNNVSKIVKNKFKHQINDFDL